MNIIRYYKIFFVFSAILVLASIISLFIFGLRFGIDFTGGSLLEVQFQEKVPSFSEIKNTLEKLDLGKLTIQPAGSKSVIVRLKDVDEETHQKILKEIGQLGDFEEKRFESIGPVIGSELKRRACWAIGFALVAIVFYVAWAFRKVSRPVASWRYGIAALVALFHDVMITIGVFSVLGHFYQVEIGLSFVAALLTILGYSVNDSIVVFDRLRENLLKFSWDNFQETVKVSIRQTIMRSINTSLTTLLVLFAIYFFGGETIKHFVLALIIGITAGTYSSIFIASPLLIIWERRRFRKM